MLHNIPSQQRSRIGDYTLLNGQYWRITICLFEIYSDSSVCKTEPGHGQLPIRLAPCDILELQYLLVPCGQEINPPKNASNFRNCLLLPVSQYRTLPSNRIFETPKGHVTCINIIFCMGCSRTDPSNSTLLDLQRVEAHGRH